MSVSVYGGVRANDVFLYWVVPGGRPPKEVLRLSSFELCANATKPSEVRLRRPLTYVVTPDGSVRAERFIDALTRDRLRLTTDDTEPCLRVVFFVEINGKRVPMHIVDYTYGTYVSDTLRASADQALVEDEVVFSPARFVVVDPATFDDLRDD